MRIIFIFDGLKMLKAKHINLLFICWILTRFMCASVPMPALKAYVSKGTTLAVHSEKKTIHHSLYRIKSIRYVSKRRNKGTQVAFLRILPERVNHRIQYRSCFTINIEDVFTKQASHIFLKRGPPSL